jgi:hypothetical protein
MSEKEKVKEPTLRDQVVEEVYSAILNDRGATEGPITKEGLLLDCEGKHFVVKVIQKKNPVYQENIKGLFSVIEAEDFDEEEDEDEVEMDEVI